MKGYLASDGVLIVLTGKSVPLYQADDIRGFRELTRELSLQLHENEPFYKRLRQSMRWLLMTLKEDGALDKAPSDLDAKEIRAVVKLNKLLFFQRFRRYCRLDPAIGVGAVHSQTSRLLVERELKEAGYYLEHEYGLLPYSDILFFRAKSPGALP